MAKDVKVPNMGESISSGILASWHVKDGDIVSSGQTLYELETDKITSEGQAETSGKISLNVSEGDEVEIGQVIAVIDESASTENAPKPTQQTASPQKETPAPAPTFSSAQTQNLESLSPAARRAAQETQADLSQIEGTGKEGRITKSDILSATEEKMRSKEEKTFPQNHSAPTKPSSFLSEEVEGRTSRSKMTPMRRKIAERLVASKQETAMLTTFNEVDMSSIMALRKTHQETFVKKHGVKLGFMSFFVKAVVNALKQVPQINAQIDGDSIIQNHFYDISIAVGGPKGLVVPVVKNCDTLSFAEIEQAIISYATKAKEGKLAIEEMMGGCFTITNGGIYGSMLSTPIINPPQSAILGMHNIKERAVVVNSQIVARPMMYLALSYDHRIVDGKEAVTFLNTVKEALEDPTKLLLKI